MRKELENLVVKLKRCEPHLSSKEIAAMHGVSKATVNRILRDAGMGRGSKWWNEIGKICLNKPRPNEKRHEPAGRAGRVECLNCGRVFCSPDVRSIRLCSQCKRIEEPCMEEHRVWL